MMQCQNCGANLQANENFCGACGAKQPQGVPESPVTQQPQWAPPVQAAPVAKTKKEKVPKKKSPLALILVSILAVALGIGGYILGTTMESTKPHTFEGPGFGTPEEAALAYMEAMKAGDMEGMIAAYAVETYAANQDLEQYTDDWSQYSLLAPINMYASDNNYLNNINVYWRIRNISQGISHHATLALLRPDCEVLKNSMVPLGDEKDLDDLDLDLDADVHILQEIEIKGVYQADDLVNALDEDDIMDWMNDCLGRDETEMVIDKFEHCADGCNDSSYQKHLAQDNKRIGANDAVSVVVLGEIDGDMFFFSPTAVEYDDTWYLVSNFSGFSNMCGDLSRMSGGFVRFTNDVVEEWCQ